MIHSHLRRRSFVLGLVLAFGSAPAFASVLVVDASGAGSFTQLQAAVDAASDGDTLLVKSGVYAGFTVADKALDIVADAGGSVRVDGSVLVQSLSATRTFTLCGFQIFGQGGSPALRFAFDAGAVRVERCLVQAAPSPCGLYSHGQAALDVDVCENVSISRSTLVGQDAGNISTDGGYGGVGGEGVTPVRSRIAFYDCHVIGGAGGGVAPALCAGTFGYGYAGGVGGWFLGCPIVFGSGCSFEGGRGSWGGVGLPSSNGPGGTGLQVFGAAPYGDTHAWWLATTTTGGAPGCAGCPGGSPASTVPPPSTSTTLAGSARRFVSRSLAREQELVRLRFEGVPGERVELFVSDAPRFAFSTGWRGVLLVSTRSPSSVLRAGTIGASGVLEIPWVVDELGPLVESRRLLMQPSFVDASGHATLGTPHTLVLLDSAY